GANDVGIALLDGHGFEQVETLALRDAFDDVNQDDVGKFFCRDPVCGRRADIPGTYNAYFLAHDKPFLVLATDLHGLARINRTKIRTSFFSSFVPGLSV